MLALDDVEPADSRRNINAHFVEIRLFRLPARHAHRKIRASQRHLDETPPLLQFFFLNPLEGVEAFDFAADAAIESGSVKTGYSGHSADAGKKIFPAFFRADAQRADQSNTRNHNAARQLFLLPNEMVLPSGVTSLWSACRYTRPRP